MSDNLPVMHKLESTNLDAVGHDPESRTLFVRFKGKDKIYEYPDVSPEKHKGLIEAKSPGSYFYAHIRPKRG